MLFRRGSIYLSQLSKVSSELVQTVEKSPSGTSTTALHAMQRHREVLQDYSREFQRTKVRAIICRRRAWGISPSYYPVKRSRCFWSRESIDERSTRHQVKLISSAVLVFWLLLLLTSVYKSSTSDMLLAERGGIESSHRMLDDITRYIRVSFLVARSYANRIAVKPMRREQSLADNILLSLGYTPECPV